MFPININNTVSLPANELSVQPVTPVQNLIDQLADLAPGQHLLAQVQSSLGNGIYRATVSQREVTLALPFAAKAGDQLELEVVSQQGKTALAVILPESPQAQNDSTPLHLSAAGKAIGMLISHHEQNPSATPLPLKANEALVITTADTPPAAAQLAPALQQAVEQSGVFYESHLARWLNGNYPEQLLRQEPQGQQAPISAENPHPASETTNSTQANNLPRPSSESPSAREIEKTITTPFFSAAEKMQEASSKTLIPAALSNIVEQQIATLNQPTLLWQGQAWTGQNMEWEISRDAPERQSIGSDINSPWRSKLTLHLPHLGTVEAVLHLDSQRTLSVQLAVANQTSQELLEQGTQQLLAHLNNAGLITAKLGITLIAEEALPADPQLHETHHG